MSEAQRIGTVRRYLRWWRMKVFGRRPGPITRTFRLGIAGRLTIAFVGVAVLVVAANLFAEHGLTLASLTSGRESAPALGSAYWLRQSVARASGAVSGSIDSYDRATEGRIRSNSNRLNASFTKAARNLDREVRAYVTAARAFADSVPVEELAHGSQDHLRSGATLVRDADQRRALSAQYASVIETVSRQVQERVDGSWNFLGRRVTRKSLIELSRAVDSARLESARLLAGDFSDSAAPAALRASENGVDAALVTYSSDLVRTQGKDWFDQMRSGVQRLGATRDELVALDRRRAGEADAFRTGGRALVNAIHALDAGLDERTRADVATKTEGSHLEATLRNEGRLLLWISAIVLSLVLLLSIATTLSIVRPVRRFIGAMGQLAAGNSTARMARGGIKEIDTLATAFNQMAGKIAAYQRQLESKLSEGTRQFLYLLDHDPLTQLPNRRQLLSHLRQSLETATVTSERHAVFFIDLDNFKTINDTMGHAFGDRVLVAIAGRAREVAGPNAFIARLGGDEFTVICRLDPGASVPAEVGSSLLQAFAAPLHVDGHELSIGISVGASLFPEHADNAEALLRAADAALFHAKALGRRRFTLFSPVLLEDLSARFRVEQGLRQAIDRDELELFFQPEVSLATLSTSVVEALLRWRMPDGTYASPASFLPVAEQSGLILEIGDWVVRHAIEITAGWYHGGRSDVRVAINVSAQQLLTPGFVVRVVSTLEANRLPSSCIELELTENVLQTDAATVEILHTLRKQGIAVALDDFGTGYSSLASLEQLPLTRVKLDRSLIAGIHTNPRSQAIAQSITELCGRLGLEVTAEGVEDLQQLSVLLPEKALTLQGYLISKPVPQDQVLPLLKTMRARMNSLLRHVRCSGEATPAAVEQSDSSRRNVVRLRPGKPRE